MANPRRQLMKKYELYPPTLLSFFVQFLQRMQCIILILCSDSESRYCDGIFLFVDPYSTMASCR